MRLLLNRYACRALFSAILSACGLLAQAQVTSTDGSFTAGGTTNLTLRTNGTTRATIDAAGNVGIGITSPADLLHVNGNARANQLNLMGGIVNTGSATTNMSFNINGTNRMTLLAASGNLGIGTAAPADLLHVNGNARANQLNLMGGIVNTGSATTNMSFNINGTNRMTLLAASGNLGIGTAAPADLLHVNGNARANQVNLVNGVLNTAGATINMGFSINGTNRMTLLAASGNLGIGTAAPADLLHVNGNARANQLNLVNGILNTAGATTNMGFNINGTNRMTLLAASGNLGIGTAAPADLLHVNGNARANQLNLVNGSLSTVGATNLSLGTNGVTQITLLNTNGNVGIGTATPAYRLDVAGTINATGLLVNGQPVSGGTSQWATGTGNISYSGGNVGIGTATPSEALEIGGTGYLKVGGGRISLDGVAGYYGNGIRYESSQVRIYQSGSLGAAFGGGVTTLYGGGNAALTVDGNQNVGIGTTTPAQKLDVAGTISATNLLVKSGADIRGSGNTSATTALRIANLANSTILTADNSGQINIGVPNSSNPNARLQIRGVTTQTGLQPIIKLEDSNGNSVFDFRDDGTFVVQGSNINTAMSVQDVTGIKSKIQSLVSGFGGTGVGSETNHPLGFLVNNSVVGGFSTNGGFIVGALPQFITASTILDVQSTTGAVVLPRMTTAQRDAITSSSAGMLIYNSSTNRYNFHNGTSWTQFASPLDSWTLGSGGTLSGVNTITSNAPSQMNYTGTFTTTANNQYYQQFGGSITARATASDNLSHTTINPTITAGANTQSLTAVHINPSFNTGAFTGVNTFPLVVGLSNTSLFSVRSDGEMMFGNPSDLNSLRVTTGGSDVFLTASGGNSLRFGHNVMTIFNPGSTDRAWVGNSGGVHALGLYSEGIATSTATQRSGYPQVSLVSMWNG